MSLTRFSASVSLTLHGTRSSSFLSANYRNRTSPSYYLISTWPDPQQDEIETDLSPIADILWSFNDQIACLSLKLALSWLISWARVAMITYISSFQIQARRGRRWPTVSGHVTGRIYFKYTSLSMNPVPFPLYHLAFVGSLDEKVELTDEHSLYLTFRKI
jgi:hypothetical protein